MRTPNPTANQTVRGGDRGRGGGRTHDLACHSHETIDVAFLQSWDGARQVFSGTAVGPQ